MFAGADVAAGERALGPRTQVTPAISDCCRRSGSTRCRSGPASSRDRLDGRRTRSAGRRSGERPRRDLRRQQLHDRRGCRGRRRRGGALPTRATTAGDGTRPPRGRRRVRSGALLGIDECERRRRHLPGDRGGGRTAGPRRRRQAGKADARRSAGRLGVRRSPRLPRLRDDGLSDVRRARNPRGRRASGT